MKKIIVLLLIIALLIPFAACTKKADTESGQSGSTEQNTPTVQKLPEVVTGSIVFSDIGTVTFELYPNSARESALNFIYLANSGHYNGVIVDRIVKGVCIQAGKYEVGYKERHTSPDYTIKGEFVDNGIENELPMVNGAIAWVTEPGEPDSAHTEFAIYPDAVTSWDYAGKVAVFGKVTGDDSFAVLEKINKRKTSNERPNKQIVISAIVINPVEQDGFAQDFEFPLPDFRQ